MPWKKSRHVRRTKYRHLHGGLCIPILRLPDRPKDLRHWVSAAYRNAGLSRRASAYLQGHDADSGSSMRDWYDNKQLEEIFQEQADCFPHGPLGTLVPVEVEMVSDLSQDGISLLRQYIAGEIAPMKVPDKLWEIKMKF